MNMSKKVISYSLWGTNPRYITQAVENARRIAELMPDWECRWYIGSNVSSAVKAKLIALGGRLIEMGESAGSSGMLWRFRVLLETDVAIALFGDADADKTKREIRLIRDWEKSGKSLFIVRDHPNHVALIMGGAWGLTQKDFSVAARMIFDGTENSCQTYGHDEYILATRLYPLFMKDSWLHSPFRVYPGEHPDSIEACLTGSFIGNIASRPEKKLCKPPRHPLVSHWPWAETAPILAQAIQDGRAGSFTRKEHDVILKGVLIGLLGLAIPHHDLGTYRPSEKDKKVFSEYLEYLEHYSFPHTKCYVHAIRDRLSGALGTYWIVLSLLRGGTHTLRRLARRAVFLLKNQ